VGGWIFNYSEIVDWGLRCVLLSHTELISGLARGGGAKGLAFLIGIIHKWNNALAQLGTNSYKFNSSQLPLSFHLADHPAQQ